MRNLSLSALVLSLAASTVAQAEPESANAADTSTRYSVSGEQFSVENSRGSKQHFPNDPTPDFQGQWQIDPATGAISGNFDFGDYLTEVEVKVFGTMRAQIEQKDIEHRFEGKGQWFENERRFVYSVPTGKSNSSLATDATGSSNCKGSGMVCDNFESTTADWEGLELELQFSPDMKQFSGTAKAIERSGSGFTKTSTTMSIRFEGTQVEG